MAENNTGKRQTVEHLCRIC